ncbi:chorismate mutase 2, cytosolic-like [Curcuma longa]|uniref:chorismate mutase 2, cytosolic-like n=1 Tax=Curcuma longa TaxID=136217 RepID=UPI003D9DCFB3
MAQEKAPPSPSPDLTLEWVRDALVRQEDSIVFALIERARFPYNAPAYNPSLFPQLGDRSLVEVFVRGAEGLQAKAGRYQNPEEVPFFPDDLPAPLITAYNFPQVLHPTSASVSVSDAIWNMYFNDLLPLITVEGDDGNYASTAASDLICLQALSRRIHFGKFVAEVKYRDAPLDYTTAIQAKDRDALMKLLTFEAVEEMVKRRVKKKAMVFGQNVTLEDKDSDAASQYKVDPSVVARLYDEWVIPFTKVVEVDYLLRRLD